MIILGYFFFFFLFLHKNIIMLWVLIRRALVRALYVFCEEMEKIILELSPNTPLKQVEDLLRIYIR